jgi:hypothetical protein
MGQCPGCGKDLLEVKNRNGTIKKFHDDKCRWNFHNRKRIDACLSEIRQAVEEIMIKYRLIR